MKQWYYNDAPVTIIGRRHGGIVLIRYEDAFEELVPEIELVKKYLPNKQRQKERFTITFGSEARVKLIKRLPCLICGVIPTVNAHVKPRSLGGTWVDIVPLCNHHHHELDNIYGLTKFNAKYGIDLSEEARYLAELYPIT